MKVKNNNLDLLLGIYAKLVVAEYDDYEIGLEITKEGYSIEEAKKALDKIRENLVKKFIDENNKLIEGKEEEANKALNKLFESEQELGLTSIPKSVLKSIKLKGLESKLLSDLKLIGD